MLNSAERINFISTYISSYESKIKLLNNNGLFDAAKLFELFAQEVCNLWFGQPFYNLNELKPNYPYVDLLSGDGNIFVQVSTAQDLPTKIKSTLEKIRDDKKKRFVDLKQVFFFVLDNESVTDIKDYSGDSKIGNIEFVKENHLITTKKIITRATTQLDFQQGLYEFLYNEVNNIELLSKRLSEEIENSKSVGLYNIDCYINDEYEIDRSKIINEIKECNDQFISIRGEAGSGKSVICKKIVENEEKILYARAERFTEVTNINDVWNLNINVALNYLNKEKIIFFIDSLEFIADAKQTKLDLLQTLFEIVKKHPNAKIITSCRTSDETAFFKIDSKYNTKSFYLEALTVTELLQISNKYPVIKPFITNNAYSSIAKTPFYLNLIIKNIKDTSNITDENNLRDVIWENVICLKNKCRRLNIDSSEIVSVIKHIVFERAKNFSVGIDSSTINSNIVDALVSEGVIVKNSASIRLKYDIFEDICFEKEFDFIFDGCKGDYNQFFVEIEQYGRCCYRRYQIWVSNKILTKINRDKFLYELIFTKDIVGDWKKQTIIGLIKSDYCKSFFDEYAYLLINEGLIQDFINIINLFGFEPGLLLSETDAIMLLNPKGKGREELIRIIYENNLYTDSKLTYDSIVKICSDYSRQEVHDSEVAKMACEILQSYFSERIENLYNAKETCSLLLNPIYQMAEFSKEWIDQFWNDKKADLISEDRTKRRISEEIIKYTLECTTVNLTKFMPNELCELAEYFWTIEAVEMSSFYSKSDDICYAFGLNKYAVRYGHLDSFKIKYRFFPNLLDTNFYIALDWSISFLNRCIEFLSKQEDVKLNKETIYFAETNEMKEYFSFNGIWLAGTEEQIVPTVMGDIIYLLRNKIVSLVKSAVDENIDCSVFVNVIKDKIINKSNSLILFTIIEDIGILLENAIPGYCLDLATNVNIIIFDIERFSKNHPNDLQKKLEQNIFNIVGLPGINRRYKSDYMLEWDLQTYFIHSQFIDKSKDYCNNILNYLYSVIPNDSENAYLHLQVQKMDFRNPIVENQDENTIAISSVITGEAKNIVDNNAIQIEPRLVIEKSIQEFLKKAINNNYCLDDVLDCINVYFKNIKRVETPFMFDEYIVLLFSYALNEAELKSELRDEFCNAWIDGVEKILANETFLFNHSFLPVLFRQIDSNASEKTKNRIKQLVLNIVTYNEDNGIVSKLKEVTKQYLKENNNLSNSILRTIVSLSRKSRLYVKNNSITKSTLFKKKRFNYSSMNKKSVLNKQNREDIITKYLYNPTSIDMSNFNIENYNIQYLYHIVNCGININDSSIKNIIKQITLSIINQLKSREHRYDDYRNVSNVKYAIMHYLEEELIDNHEVVFDILFDNVDFSCFAGDAIDFYLDVFGKLLPFYVDSYQDKHKRALCEKIIYSLESKLNECVCDGYVKERLYKALFLSARGYEGDWSKVNTNYSFADIQFLNKMFSKYGKYDFEFFIGTLYMMKLDKLLPYVLTSINSVIDEVIKDNSINKSCFNKTESIVDQIITMSFLQFNDEIKQDLELTNAYEHILKNLISLGNQNAAVILDEFRTH